MVYIGNARFWDCSATASMAAGISDHVWAIEEIVTVSDMIQ